VRSRAAASTLQNNGFDYAYSLDGGIRAWNGQVASGLPEADLSLFRQLAKPAEQIALAWVIEEGTRQFYLQVADLFSQELGSSVFHELAAEEDKHKALLLSMYEIQAEQPAGENFPANALEEVPEDLMEGGMRVGESLEWLKGRDFQEALELAISVEVNAYDRYLVLQRELSTDQTRDDFRRIAEQEKRHLARLSQLFSDNLS
jgi:rubrerythrin